MKAGAERKKVWALGILGVLAVYSIYTNVLSDPEIPEQARRANEKKAAAVVAPPTEGGRGQQSPAVSPNAPPRPGAAKRPRGGSAAEFRPSLKPARPEDRPDPIKVDPTLRLDLLAKLQKVTIDGGGRSLFEFGKPPPPPPPTKEDGEKIRLAASQPPPPPPNPGGTKPDDPPKAPPPPPIPLKYYGLTSPRAGAGAEKRAFFIEADEIYVAAEGELIKKRYKVVRIQVNSAVVEDTQHKHQQTLTLDQPPVTG